MKVGPQCMRNVAVRELIVCTYQFSASIWAPCSGETGNVSTTSLAGNGLS